MQYSTKFRLFTARSVFQIGLIVGLLMALTPQSSANDQKNDPSSYKRVTRKAGSMKPMTQAEAMAQNERGMNPQFMKPATRGPASAVKLGGVCRDANGRVSGSSDTLKYQNCVESISRVSGANPEDYYGMAGRQTGVGILLSK